MEYYLLTSSIGFLVSVVTSLILGVKSAIKLPGGAVAVGLSVWLFNQDLNLVLLLSFGGLGHLLFIGLVSVLESWRTDD